MLKGIGIAGVMFSLLMGCGSNTCVTGASAPCACANGRSGAQTCTAAGTFSACVCTGSTDAGTDVGTPGSADARVDVLATSDIVTATDVPTTTDVSTASDVATSDVFDAGAVAADVPAADVTACPTGLTACGSVCLNTLTDSSHCGSCGIACGPDSGCVAGTCVSGPTGSRTFTISDTFVVPAGVTSISVVLVGAGASTSGSGGGRNAGGGGGLCYLNDIAVTPGTSIPVLVGLRAARPPGAGGNSTFRGVTAFGGQLGVGGLGGAGGGGGGAGATCFTGGSGGSGSGGGGGAAGYAGNGGTGGSGSTTGCPTDATAGAGGGGGGGGACGGAGGCSSAGGGGVGLLGMGANGAAGAGMCSVGRAESGGGGSGGAPGAAGASNAGDFGGGAGAFGTGGNGAVRIIWGPGRSFPDHAM